MTEFPSSGIRFGNREVTRLLAAVLGEDAVPMDLVVARLHETDSARWVTDALAPRAALLAQPDAPRESFLRWKDEAKSNFARAVGDPVLVTSTFLDYATSIACAIDRGHGVISSIPEAEITGMLERIGPLLPGEWKDTFARARGRMGA
jgi:hypothetical protein